MKLEFDSNGAGPGTPDQPYPGVSAVRRGDVANFDATLERCDAPQTQDPNNLPPLFPDCIDYASNPGNWVPAGSNAVAIGLPAVNKGGLEELQVSDTSPFVLGSPPALPVPGSKTPPDPGTPADLARTVPRCPYLHTHL